jgi:hypothetical protein
MKIQIDETIYQGTGAEIMEQLRRETFDPEEFPDTESYIRFLRGNALRAGGLDIPLPEGGVERRARAVFTALAQAGALTILED